MCLACDKRFQTLKWTFCRSLHNQILFALWFKTTLQNGFVVKVQVLWLIWSPDVELNLLPQSSQWYPVCSLIQNYSSKRLFGDETSLVSNLKSRCQIELFAAILTMKSCFSLIHENSFIDLWCFPWVFLSNLKFQYQYLLFFSIPTCFNT